MADVELDARVTALEENGGGGGNVQNGDISAINHGCSAFNASNDISILLTCFCLLFQRQTDFPLIFT